MSDMPSSQLLSPTERRWLLELRTLHTPAFYQGDAVGALGERMHALSKQTPSVFQKTDFLRAMDYTDRVAVARQDSLEMVIPIDLEYMAERIGEKVRSLNESGIHVGLEDGLAYARAETAIIGKVQQLNRPVFVFNLSITAWFFDTRAAFQMGTALSAGEINPPFTAEVVFVKGVMPPAVIFLPGFNEICLNTSLAVHRDDPSVWAEFEADFRSFLSRADHKALSQCTLCHVHTQLPLTRCGICGKSLCPTCFSQVACGCPRPTHLKIQQSEVEGVTLDGALTRMANATQARPTEEPMTMNIPMRRK